MLCLVAPGQVFANDQLEEVEGGVKVVLVELQLTAHLLDLTLTCIHKGLLRLWLTGTSRFQTATGLTVLKHLGSQLFTAALV